MLLALRATWLGTVRASALSAKADRQHLITVPLPAQRGSIISADGQALAVPRPTMLITADGRYVRDAAATAQKLTSATGGTAKDRARIERDFLRKRAYVIVAKHVPIKQAEYLRSLDLDGVHFERTATRNYPQGKVAGQVLGLTDLDSGQGIGEGLEKSRNDVLSGKDGKRVEIRDPRYGETVRISEARDSVPGSEVELTINAKIQGKFETILAESRRTYHAKRAMGVIMDPNTGAILAMTSVPRLDPNNRATLDPATTQNRSITDPYEPGSVFKPFIVAGALEEGVVTPTTRFNLPPEQTFAPDTPDEFTIHEAHRTEWKTLDVSGIVQESSNIGVLRVAYRLGKTGQLRPWLVKFGFGQKTQVDLAAESGGNLPPRKAWNLGTLKNIPLGQGLTATQIQQVRAYAAIANGGFLVQPHVVARVGGHSVAPTTRERILTPKTSLDLTKMLETVIEGSNGTAFEAKLEGYKVAGKTGTAQVVDPKTQKYIDRYRSSFIGYVPSRNPRLLIAVMLDDPDPAGPHTGGAVAAPAFEKIADYALGVLSIPPSG